MERIAALGHGDPSELTSEQALSRSRAAEPENLAPNNFVDPAGFEVGQTISIAATDYGVEPVTGVLAWQDAEQIAIARTNERAGRVRVHFPRIGFRLAAT